MLPDAPSTCGNRGRGSLKPPRAHVGSTTFCTSGRHGLTDFAAWRPPPQPPAATAARPSVNSTILLRAPVLVSTGSDARRPSRMTFEDTHKQLDPTRCSSHPEHPDQRAGVKTRGGTLPDPEDSQQTGLGQMPLSDRRRRAVPGIASRVLGPDRLAAYSMSVARLRRTFRRPRSQPRRRTCRRQRWRYGRVRN